jgi:tetratricopeptide (TPR) repeat protein
MLPVLAFAVVLSANPVEEARANLKAGKLDDVLFALDGKKLPDAEKPKAAQVLGESAKAAWEKNDAALSLQFAQMALKLEPNQLQALEAGSRAAFSQQQFEIADSYAERWLKADGANGEAHVYRAELANEAGEWQRALDALEGAKLDVPQQKRADLVKMKADNELAAQKQGRSELNTIERQMAKQQDDAAAERQGERSEGPRAPSMRHDQVILYTKSTDPMLAAQKLFFAQHHTAVAVKLVDTDPGAMTEMMAKEVQRGQMAAVTPVVDVRGRLVIGWNTDELERALKK